MLLTGFEYQRTKIHFLSARNYLYFLSFYYILDRIKGNLHQICTKKNEASETNTTWVNLAYNCYF